MKKLILPLVLVATAPLAAQSFEVGVFVGQQSYKDVDLGSGVSMKADSKTVVGARFGYSLVDIGPALFQVTLGYQPEAKSDVKGTVSGVGSATIGEFKASHISVGAMFNFKAVVAVGAGVEYRSEKLSGTINSGTPTPFSESTTYGRPWFRANIGYAIPSPLVKPFFGLEVATPLTSKSNDVGSSDDVLKSAAPKLQVGIYAGLRF